MAILKKKNRGPRYFLKWTTPDGKSPFVYSQCLLPTKEGEADWMPRVEGRLKSCDNGYHFMGIESAWYWRPPSYLSGRLWLIEVRGTVCYEPWRSAGEQKAWAREVRFVKELEYYDFFSYDKGYMLRILGKSDDMISHIETIPSIYSKENS